MRNESEGLSSSAPTFCTPLLEAAAEEEEKGYRLMMGEGSNAGCRLERGRERGRERVKDGGKNGMRETEMKMRGKKWKWQKVALNLNDVLSRRRELFF